MQLQQCERILRDCARATACTSLLARPLTLVDAAVAAAAAGLVPESGANFCCRSCSAKGSTPRTSSKSCTAILLPLTLSYITLQPALGYHAGSTPCEWHRCSWAQGCPQPQQVRAQPADVPHRQPLLRAWLRAVAAAPASRPLPAQTALPYRSPAAACAAWHPKLSAPVPAHVGHHSMGLVLASVEHVAL